MRPELKDTIEAAKKAGERILEIYHSDFEVHEKEGKELVTEADISSQKIILSYLKKYDYGILSEEKKDDLSRLEKEKVWIIDPLDGTKDFVNKTGDFSVMVALVEKHEPILGVVYQPTEDKLCYAEKGKGAYLIEKGGTAKKLEVSDISDFSKSRFAFTRFHLEERMKKFIEEGKQEIVYKGSAGLKIIMVAKGEIEGFFYFSPQLKHWDICALEIILKEAGGKGTDLKGNDFVYNTKEVKTLNGSLFTNGKIHFQAIEKLNKFLNI